MKANRVVLSKIGANALMRYLSEGQTYTLAEIRIVDRTLAEIENQISTYRERIKRRIEDAQEHGDIDQAVVEIENWDESKASVVLLLDDDSVEQAKRIWAAGKYPSGARDMILEVADALENTEKVDVHEKADI